MSVGWLVECFATFVEYLCGFYFLSDETDRVFLKKYRLLFVLFITGVTIYINSLRILSFYSIGAYIIYFSLISIYFYRNQWLEKILLTMSSLILIIICDYFSMAFLGTILHRSDFMSEVMNPMGLVRICFLLIDKSLLVCCVFLIKKYCQRHLIQEKGKFTFAVGFVTVFLVYVTYNFASIYAFLSWTVFALGGILLMMVFFYYKKWKDAETMKELLSLKNSSYMDYYKELCEQQEQQNRQLHDVRYQHITLRQLLDEHRYQECGEYLDKISAGIDRSAFRIYTGNRYIDFLLNYKKREAEKQEIRFVIDADVVGQTIDFCQEDINVILGNLLDNAIEACERMEEGDRWIEIKINRIKRMLFITIQNSFGKSPVVRKDRLITEKENTRIHGLGLQNVKECVEKCGGTFEIKHNDHVFTSEVTIF